MRACIGMQANHGRAGRLLPQPPTQKDSVDTQTRHALKQDPLVQATRSGADWFLENRRIVIRTAILLAVVLLIVLAVSIVANARSSAAENAFGTAMDTLTTPIASAAQPMPPGTKTFPNDAERAKVANPLFLNVARQYGMTEAGHDALYFTGLTYAQMGNPSEAETYLKKAVSAASKNTASLANLALANLYTQTGRSAQAIDLLQKLVAHPTSAVPQGTAQLNLAAIYQTTDPGKARAIYTLLKEKDRTTAAGEIAQQKLTGK